ncbi:MAG: DUF3182 family protein [Pseudohongiella sp.]|nr:DUF3182 family protein [Pseudohongiella sp.]
MSDIDVYLADSRLIGMASGVFVCPCPRVSSPHEVAVHGIIGQEVAKLLGREFLGNCPEEQIGKEGGYYIPADTLVGSTGAFNNLAEDNFFGGLVRQRWMATKAISHPLWGDAASAPEAWTPLFAELAGDSVLRGYTVFSLVDARRCGDELLLGGAVRLKIPEGKACQGQVTVNTTQELVAALTRLSTAAVEREGLVIEENLTDVMTHSVGQINISGLKASYVGTQNLTADNAGRDVYGGSSLMMVRGGYDELLRLRLAEALKKSILQALRFESAAFASFDGLVLSRRNYDVAHGMNAVGEKVSGVLEQSWRIGGASSAEIFGLRRLCEQPELSSVRTTSLELYGHTAPPPSDAISLYQGDDPDVGYIAKYVRVVSDVCTN